MLSVCQKKLHITLVTGGLLLTCLPVQAQTLLAPPPAKSPAGFEVGAQTELSSEIPAPEAAPVLTPETGTAQQSSRAKSYLPALPQKTTSQKISSQKTSGQPVLQKIPPRIKLPALTSPEAKAQASQSNKLTPKSVWGSKKSVWGKPAQNNVVPKQANRAVAKPAAPKSPQSLSKLSTKPASGWGQKQSVWGSKKASSTQQKVTIPSAKVTSAQPASPASAPLKAKASQGWGQKQSVWGRQKAQPAKQAIAPIGKRQLPQNQKKPTGKWGQKSVWGSKKASAWGNQQATPAKKPVKPAWRGLKKRQNVPEIGYMTPQGTVVGNGNPGMNHPDDHDPFAKLEIDDINLSLNDQ